MKRMLLAVAFVFGVGIGVSTPASAAVIPVCAAGFFGDCTDFDTLGLGTVQSPQGTVAGPLLQTPILNGPDEPVLGLLSAVVWADNSGHGPTLYTYGYEVSPCTGVGTPTVPGSVQCGEAVVNISGYDTTFSAGAFNGVAGLSMSQSTTAGAFGANTVISYDDVTGVLSWGLIDQSQVWSSGTPLTFFFQTFSAPVIGAPITLTNLEVGAAITWATVAIPEPSTLLLVGSGLVALGFLGSRRRRS